MKIGSMDGSLAQPWERLFRVAAQIGFEGIELGVGEDYPKTKLWKKEGRQELKALSESSKVTIASICIHAYWRFSFAGSEGEISRTAHRIAEEAAAIASEVGARNLLIPVTSAEGVTAEEARTRWIQGIRSCAGTAEDYGVIFALENVGQPFATNGRQLASIVDEINSPAVKAYYDPGNAIYKDLDPLEDIRILGGRISQVHMKDPGGEHLGEGKMNIPSVMRALRAINYNGWIMLETPPTDDPIEAGRINLEYLRQLL
jgi:L-ribulose-5-phosphate 3-epimerase